MLSQGSYELASICRMDNMACQLDAKGIGHLCAVGLDAFLVDDTQHGAAAGAAHRVASEGVEEQLWRQHLEDSTRQTASDAQGGPSKVTMPSLEQQDIQSHQREPAETSFTGSAGQRAHCDGVGQGSGPRQSGGS